MKINSSDIFSALSKVHKHNNENIIEKITEENGKILYKNKPLSSAELTDLTLGNKMFEFPEKNILENNDLIVFFDEEDKKIKKINMQNLISNIKIQSMPMGIITTGHNTTARGSSKKTLEYLNLSTFSNSVEIGELFNERFVTFLIGSTINLYVIGGYIFNSDNTNFIFTQNIEFVSFKSLSHSANFGSLSINKVVPYGTGNNIMCIINGADKKLTVNTTYNFSKIDYASAILSTLSINYTLPSSMIYTEKSLYGVNNQIKAFFSTINEIKNERFYTFFSSLVTVKNYGTLGSKESSTGAANNTLKSLTQTSSAGSYNVRYFLMASETQEVDFPSLIEYGSCAMSKNTKAIFVSTKNVLTSIDFASNVGSVIFGNLTSYTASTEQFMNRSASSNSHGGLYY